MRLPLGKTLYQIMTENQCCRDPLVLLLVGALATLGTVTITIVVTQHRTQGLHIAVHTMDCTQYLLWLALLELAQPGQQFCRLGRGQWLFQELLG